MKIVEARLQNLSAYIQRTHRLDIRLFLAKLWVCGQQPQRSPTQGQGALLVLGGVQDSRISECKAPSLQKPNRAKHAQLTSDDIAKL